MTLNIGNKKIELASVWYNYLYPYLIRFCLYKNIGIEWKNDTIQIPVEYENDLNVLFKRIFKELLSECYVEPTHKQRSKYSTRYRKIEFDGSVYVLNYRTDIVGIIGYALDYLISETEG